jgi:hypothetical protein
MRVAIRILAVAGIVLCTMAALGQDTSSPTKTMPEGVAAQTEPVTTAPAPQPQIYRRPGTVVVPESSIVRAEDAGLRAHTNVEIFVPAGRPMASIIPDNTFAETPASLGCVYRESQPSYKERFLLLPESELQLSYTAPLLDN